MFPKTIWQTYSTHEIPLVARPCVKSWARMNSDWTVKFQDDAEIAHFVTDYLGAKAGQLLRSLPLGVMQADFWRYAVLHKYGGVYADLDTVCRCPIEMWCSRPKGLLLGVENKSGVHFCQWAFASVPEHPVLETTINLLIARAERGIDTRRPHYVHYHTGPALWSDAIRLYLGLGTEAEAEKRDLDQPSAQDILQNAHLWQNTDVVLLSDTAFNGNLVAHLAASERWHGVTGYESWTANRFLV